MTKLMFWLANNVHTHHLVRSRHSQVSSLQYEDCHLLSELPQRDFFFVSFFAFVTIEIQFKMKNQQIYNRMYWSVINT